MPPIERGKRREPARGTDMIDLAKIDELAKRLAAALPPGAGQIRADLEGRFRAILQRALAKADLVTREEFDLQKAALARAQARLEELQQALDTLRKD